MQVAPQEKETFYSGVCSEAAGISMDGEVGMGEDVEGDYAFERGFIGTYSSAECNWVALVGNNASQIDCLAASNTLEAAYGLATATD